MDIVEVRRFERMLEQCSEAQLETIYTPAEIAYCRSKKNPTLSLAGRFAVKESCMKLFPRETALKEIDFADFEVVVDCYGSPNVRITDKLSRLLARSGSTTIAVSLSHTDSFACGMAIAK